MIFVTVGTQLPFDRLIRAMDSWASAHPDTAVFAQTGQLTARNHTPQHMDHAPNLSPEAFDEKCRNAQLIVAHAGTGSLMTAHSAGTPLLMMPRRADLGEHRNDHQRATADRFGQRQGIHVAWDETTLPAAIQAALNAPNVAPQLGTSADDSLIHALRDVIFAQR